MRKITHILFICVMALMTGFSWAAAGAPVKDPYADFVNKNISAFMAKNKIPGAAVVLYVHGKPYAYQYGYVDNRQKYRVTRYTIFEVGSITKLMTSLLLAQELDYARVALNDPIQQYIQDLPGYHFKNITLQSLATHTSGLPLHLPAGVRSDVDLQKFLARWRPEYSPGRQWIYSNVGMGLLGIALENSTEMQLNDLYLRHILLPLDMQPIGLTVPRKLQHFMAQGYRADGSPAPPVHMGVFPAAYGVKMSASDMQKFLGAAIGLPGTPERIFYPMLMTQTPYVKLRRAQQGLGWQINQLATGPNTDSSPAQVEEVISRQFYSPKVLLDKTGSTSGFKAYMAVIPYKKSGIAIMINKSIASNEIVSTAKNILYAANGL